jgi:hypothetical protein
MSFLTSYRATIDIRTVPSQDRGDVVALLQALVDEVAATVPAFARPSP